MSRAVRLVLALYPRAVRERYGAEIADLLTHSRRPMRDLADVTRCGLAERGRALGELRLRSHLRVSAGLVLAPVAFTGYLLAVHTVLAVTGVLVEAVAGRPAAHRYGALVPAVTALLVAVGGIWLSRRVRLSYPAAFAPAVLTAGALPLMLLLIRVEPWAVAAAFGCWTVAMCALSTGAAAMARRGRRRRAVLWTTLGGVVACELACAVHALAVSGSIAVAAGAYPIAALGLDPAMFGERAGQVADAMMTMPALLTICTAYVLGLVTVQHRLVRGPVQPVTHGSGGDVRPAS